MTNNLITKILNQRSIPNSRVLSAFKAVERQSFLRSFDSHLSELDQPISIGFNQTISQPSTVFDMVEALDLKAVDKVLEIGVGSGYATAIIAAYRNLEKPIHFS